MKLKDGRESHRGQHPTHFALEKLTDDEMVALNSCAKQSFRNQADKDYIAARAVYRLKCTQQFLWLAEQALEKYLKAILIYNFVSAKEINHNLTEALLRVRSIPDLPFDFPEDVEEYVGYLSHYGTNRYLDRPMTQSMDALQMLDRTVWYIRKWCYFIRALAFKDNEGKHRSFYSSDIKRLIDPCWKKYRHCYRISGGYLEEVIKGRLPGYDELIWKNFYYGRRAKRKIRVERELRFENPIQEVIPEAFSILEQYVKFNKDVARYYKEQAHSRMLEK